MLHLGDDSHRSVRPVVNVGLDFGDAVDPLGQGRQLFRLEVHASHFLGPLVQHNDYVQVSPGEPLAHHPLAAIFLEELLHVHDESIKFDLELLFGLLLLCFVWSKSNCWCS